MLMRCRLPRVEGWNFQSCPRPPGWGEGLEVKSIANGQRFNQSCRGNETFIKGWGSESFCVNTWRFGESGVPGEGTDAPHPFPIPCPMHLFHLAIPDL